LLARGCETCRMRLAQLGVTCRSQRETCRTPRCSWGEFDVEGQTCRGEPWGKTALRDPLQASARIPNNFLRIVNYPSRLCLQHAQNLAAFLCRRHRSGRPSSPVS
jgi:hypothetical protein